MPRPGRPGTDAAVHSSSSRYHASICDSGIVDLPVAAYCHGLSHALQAERPEGTADALTY